MVGAVLGVLILAGPARGGLIEAVGTAERVQTGAYAGWYKYTYDLTWDLDKGLSHGDLVHKPGCAETDHVFRFPSEENGTPDGFSTGEDWESGDPVSLTVPWHGGFRAGGDPSVGLTTPLVKWEPMSGEPGKVGVGQFWYYANIAPEYGTYADVLAGKAGPETVYGDLSGAYPSCTTVTVPEPSTLGLVLLGVALWRRGRRSA